LRGIFNQEKLSDRVQNSVMQLMDKKEYEDAFKVVEDAGASEQCVSVLRELVKLRGKNVSEVVDKVKRCVKEYEASLAAAENLGMVLRLIKESGCETDLTVEAGFARGLEYYTGVIFEVDVPNLDVALGGGGRYDRLIELYGGEPTPAVGVAHGLDRIMLALQMAKSSVARALEARKVAVVPVKEELNGEALRIAETLRDADVGAEIEVMGRKMAKALEDADRRKMDYAVIVGERELKEGAGVVRDLKTRQQKVVPIKRLVETLKT
jgi:histidyl-tRNA synthetase